MWTSVCACLTAPRRVPQPAAAARPHSAHDKTAAAGREKWAFDPESVGQARAARTRRADVARWATDALPAAVEREACGVVFREANGSACVVFAFESGANVVVDLPAISRAREVLQAQLERLRAVAMAAEREIFVRILCSVDLHSCCPITGKSCLSQKYDCER